MSFICFARSGLCAALLLPQLLAAQAADPEAEVQPGGCHQRDLGLRMDAAGEEGSTACLLQRQGRALASPRRPAASPTAVEPEAYSDTDWAALLHVVTAEDGGEGVQEQDSNRSLASSVRVVKSSTVAMVDQNQAFWKAQYDRSYATTFGTNGQPGMLREMFVTNDRLRVYRDANRACSVVIAGTNFGFSDCMAGAGVPVNMPGCKLTGVYSCFVKELNVFLKNPQWPDMASYLTSSACRGGVSVAGWSLGGSLASMFASCANHARGGNRGGTVQIDGRSIRMPRVQGVYTYGASKVSAFVQPTNGRASSGIFPGIRFWTERPKNGGMQGDTCVVIPDSPTSSHAKMAAMRLRYVSGGSWNPVTAGTLFGANSQEGKGNLPYTFSGLCPRTLHDVYGRYIAGIATA